MVKSIRGVSAITCRKKKSNAMDHHQQTEHQVAPRSRLESAPAVMEQSQMMRKEAAAKLRRMSDDVHEWRFDLKSVVIAQQACGSFVRRAVRRVSLTVLGETSENQEEEEEMENTRKLQRPHSVQ